MAARLIARASFRKWSARGSEAERPQITHIGATKADFNNTSKEIAFTCDCIANWGLVV
jgi:hypothetical protein